MSRQDSWWERHWLKVLTIALVLMFVVPVIFNYWMAPMIFEQNRQAGEKIAKDTMDEDAVQDYRWFRSQWYDIKSAREQLENYKRQEARFHNQTWPNGEWKDSRSARTRHGRLHDRIVGQENVISSMVAEYNARRSDATRAIFTCGLPYNIDEKLYIADASGVEYTSQEAKNTVPPEDPSECKFAQDPSEAGASNTSSIQAPPLFVGVEA